MWTKIEYSSKKKLKIKKLIEYKLERRVRASVYNLSSNDLLYRNAKSHWI